MPVIIGAMKRFLILALGAGILAASSALAQTAEFRHGLSTFGELKYAADFKHFDYVRPDAPKGGLLKLSTVSPYDSFNPFVLRGVAAPGVSVLWESLMAGSGDEPDAAYGLIAESVAVAMDKSAVEFKLRKGARWHDGRPITAADVVFSFHALTEKGHPQYKLLFKDFEAVDALAPDHVRFRFKADALKRDLPLLAAGMPILPKHYYDTHAFERTTLDPPLGSGPYRIGKFEQGRSVVYERVEDYWGAELPVNRGRNNFGQIRYDVYRDRDIALEAFKAGEYDWREEFTSRAWATAYDSPAVKDGRIKRETLPDGTPSGVQAYFFNLRRSKFQDIRVRRAIGYGFDFEWSNKTLFYGQYDRMASVFENSELKAKGTPTAEELAQLEPFRGKIPEEVFGPAYAPHVTDGSGQNRDGLRKARDLLTEAGYKVVANQLIDAAGKAFGFEILGFEPSFERVHAPFLKNLERLGIKATMRFVDVPQYKSRIDDFDFDVTVMRYVQPLTPGIEQINYWGSSSADIPGSNNVAGIKNPAIDAMIEKLMQANDRKILLAATRALDRIVMHNHYLVPQWYKGSHNIAYWDRFARPQILPRFALGFPDTWWVDEAKDAALRRAPGKN